MYTKWAALADVCALRVILVVIITHSHGSARVL